MDQPARVTILSREIDFVRTADEAIECMSLPRARPFSALFCNVHMLMLSREDDRLRAAMESADFVFADGNPVAWLQSRLAGKTATTIRGYQAMLLLCEKAEARGLPIGLHGSSEDVLERLKKRLNGWYPDLNIAWCHAPQRVTGELVEEDELLEEINRLGIQYLFIALGCPKQEKWVNHHRAKLTCNVLAVGAAFDWLAGVEPMAPEWVESHGLTWLHRWVHHPLRFLKRYGYYNTKFVILAVAQLLRRRRR